MPFFRPGSVHCGSENCDIDTPCTDTEINIFGQHYRIVGTDAFQNRFEGENILIVQNITQNLLYVQLSVGMFLG